MKANGSSRPSKSLLVAHDEFEGARLGIGLGLARQCFEGRHGALVLREVAVVHRRRVGGHEARELLLDLVLRIDFLEPLRELAFGSCVPSSPYTR